MNGHIDLFSGIGGFSIAAHWACLRTEVFCEKDKRCREFLSRTYPGIPIFEDVRDFDGSRWRGRFLLTGGVPCQPASRAGKQGGKGDDRWLWPEAIRIIDEAKPRWCLFENPPGIYDVGLDGILADLESIGYETGIVEIPACAVNSPQIRQRVWIVAHCDEAGRKGRGELGEQDQRGEASINGGHDFTGPGEGCDLGYTSESERRILHEYGQSGGADIDPGGASQGDMADTITEQHRINKAKQEGRYKIQGCDGQWDSYHWTPCADGKLRRTPDDSFGLVDGLHRSVLAALGNSIVPQVAYEIIKAIITAEKAVDNHGES